MERTHSSIPFKRYADDAVYYHCRYQWEIGREFLVLKPRLIESKLEANPEKTDKVYCKDSHRKDSYPNISFDVLRYTFRLRLGINRRSEVFTNFGPLMSSKALKRIKDRIRQWDTIGWSNRTLIEIAKALNPAIQG